MKWLLNVALLASVVLVCIATELPCNSTCVHGTCVADHRVLSCSCEDNWFGDDCSEFICERDSGLCQNGGTCVQHPGNVTVALCSCPEGVFGLRCQYLLKSSLCNESSCGGHGDCYGSTDGYVCMCDDDRYGPDCQYSGNDTCKAVNYCHGKGNCSYAGEEGLADCDCMDGYEDLFECIDLKPNRNDCKADAMRCKNGGMCIATGADASRCNCPPAFTGENCTEDFDVCRDRCKNGGTCSVIAGGHYYECSCPLGYSGQLCQILPDLGCPPDAACQNGGTLMEPGCACMCPPGYTGSSCDTRDRCSESPCLSNSICFNTAAEDPGYVCACEDGWAGGDCQVNVTQCLQENSTATGLVVCPNPDCPRLANNGQCDVSCDSQLCGRDGGDCLARDPWAACTQPSCRMRHGDGRCDEDCDTRDCLYDGRDCATPPGVCEQECVGVAGDGICQEECYTSLCPFDGQDCAPNTESRSDFAKNRLVLILFSEPGRPFTSPWKEEFLKQLGDLLNSIPVIREVKLLTWKDLDTPPPPDTNLLIYRVVLQLNISQCVSMCPVDADDAVRWIDADIANGRQDVGPYAVHSASTQQDPDDTSDSPTIVYAIIGSGVALVVLGVLVVTVLLGKRRRVMAKIWRPTSPSEAAASTDTAGSSGATSISAAPSALAMESKDYMDTGSKKAKMISDHVKWEDCVVPGPAPTGGSGGEEQQSAVVVGQRGVDQRRWVLAHTENVGKLVQQFKQVNGSNLGVDTPGPGGFTPLMLVVMRRTGIMASMNYQSRSSSESSSDDQTALIPTSSRVTPRHMLVPPVDSTVCALIEAKANLDAVNDYNQTALHLAAACSRPEYVDQLVESGANPNIQDNWGQSPLHAAIGAGAEGAFMVLLNCSRTKYNLKSDGGVTPLMAAVKMVNGFMVKQLLKKDSEIISSTDDDGRTAVHWAAMVDNVEALRMLVKCGAETIKDAQDSKGQTPLFLACREGSVMCVKHLLDCFANVTLLDSLEQSPMQMAMQKQNVDIVELLRASSHGPLYMRPHNGFPADMATYSPSGHTQLSTFASSKKRKPKNASSSSTANGGHFSPKFLPHQVGYPSPATAMPPVSTHPPAGESIAMSELQVTSTGSGYAHHESPPTYHTPHTMASHSPPLPPHCQPHNYPPTSTHGHYSTATPTTSGYSEVTPTTYADLPPSSIATHCNGNSMHVLENYPPLYPTSTADAGTRPLQHLPVAAEPEPYSLGGAPITPDSSNPFPGGAYSPPQSGGSVSHPSPQSAQHASPNSTGGYVASPQSLTPSPESQQQRQQMIAAVGTVHGTVHVEPGYSYPGSHSMYPQHFVGSTPV